MQLIMFTGLSGAGKSTMALALSQELTAHGYSVEVIDGDQYRHSLNKDLGFSEADRRENIRRLVEVAIANRAAADVVLIAAINPFEDQRQAIARAGEVLLVYMKCSLDVLIARDTKGLYRRAMLPDGDVDKLNNLSGVNDRYDVPASPAFTIDSSVESAEDAAKRLTAFVLSTLPPA